jgi:hypothetical protein
MEKLKEYYNNNQSNSNIVNSPDYDKGYYDGYMKAQNELSKIYENYIKLKTDINISISDIDKKALKELLSNNQSEKQIGEKA